VVACESFMINHKSDGPQNSRYEQRVYVLVATTTVIR
jgi:hypothetical protein